MIRKITVLMLVLVFFAVQVMAQELVVTRETPQQAKIGEILEVGITVKNPGGAAGDVFVKEMVPAYVEIVEPEPVYEQWEGLRAEFFRWIDTMPADSEKTFTYKIKPLRVGELSFSPTTVLFDGGAFGSEPVSVQVACEPNGICDTNIGENFQTCPLDCISGIADNQCDYRLDGRCDPDCEVGYDPDCLPEAPKEAPPAPEIGIEIYAAIILVAIAALAAAAALYMRKGKRA